MANDSLKQLRSDIFDAEQKIGKILDDLLIEHQLSGLNVNVEYKQARNQEGRIVYTQVSAEIIVKP